MYEFAVYPLPVKPVAPWREGEREEWKGRRKGGRVEGRKGGKERGRDTSSRNPRTRPASRII